MDLFFFNYKKGIWFALFFFFLNGLCLPKAIPMSICNAINILCHIYLISLFFIHKNKLRNSDLWFLPVCFVVSVLPLFTAWTFQNQGIVDTFRASKTWLDIFLVFFLISKNYTKEDVYKGCTIFGFFWIIAYVLSIVVYPQSIFYNPYEEFEDFLSMQRGWYRIYIAGSNICYLLFYWNLQKYAINKDNKYLFYCILFYLCILSSLSRQHILINSAFFVWIIIRELSTKYKILFLSVFLFIVLYYIPQTEIYQTMNEYTVLQMEKNDGGRDDVRLHAAEFYLNYNDNIGQLIFGNGYYHPETSYGKYIGSIITNYGYVLSDIGLISFFFYFGIYGVIVFGVFFMKIFKRRMSTELQFSKYYLGSAILGTIMSNQLNNSMACISIIIYLLYLETLNKEDNYVYRQIK